MQSAAQKFLDQEQQYDELYGSQELATPRVIETPRRRILAGVSRVRLLFCAAMMVAVVSLTIYNNVAMVELGDRLNRQTVALQELCSDGEQLQARLDGAISLGAVAEQASSQMLLGKESAYQISYVSLGEGDRVQRTTKTPDQLPAQRVLQTLRKLQAYMENH